MKKKDVSKLFGITVRISELKNELEGMGNPGSTKEWEDALELVEEMRRLSAEGMEISGTDSKDKEEILAAADKCVRNHKYGLRLSENVDAFLNPTPPIEPESRVDSGFDDLDQPKALAALKKMRLYLDVTIRGMEGEDHE